MADWESNRGSGSLNNIQVVGLTDVGRVRKNNEDNFLIADLAAKMVPEPSQTLGFPIGERGTLLLVSDGMGGRNAGEVASQIIVDVFRSELFNREFKQANCELLAEITKKANWAVWSRAQRNIQEQGMGATLTALIVETNKAHIVQVGDSRAYIVRNGKIFRLTKDQSMVQTLIDSGIIQPEEAETHPYRHVILQSLGAEPTVYPVTSTIDLYNGDCLLLCTDGLSNMIKDEHLQQLIVESPNIGSTCHTLLETANGNGGKDNITVVLASLLYGETAEMADFGMRTFSYFTPTAKLPPLPKMPDSTETETPEPAVAEPPPPPPPEPVETPAFGASAEAEPATAQAGELDRILLIHSDPENLLMFEFMLKPFYEVLTATDGEEGLAKAITEHPRLIVASVEAEKVSGFNLCQALKGNERFRNIPLILISEQHREKSHIIEGLTTGADDYMVAPIDERELLLRVKPHIERAKMLESLRYESALNEATNLQLTAEMEAIAKARQDIFQNVLDATSDGILILDSAGWVTAVNETFIDFHRVQREHIVGFGYRALLKKIQHLYVDPERQLQRFNELINNPEMIVEDDIKTRSERRGTPNMKRYSAPVRDESGKVYGRFFVFRNLIL